MKRGFNRGDRVSDLIQKSLANLLLQMGDARFHFVTITGVQVARDIGYAKVFVSILEDDAIKIKAIVDALNGASKRLRYNLARVVKLRIIPELKFVYDESTAHGFKISHLIESAIKKSGK
jgi:ribosome-binding factor A